MPNMDGLRHPDIEALLESRAKGWLGVYFVRDVADRVEYRRRDRCDIVTLTKRGAHRFVDRFVVTLNVPPSAGTRLGGSIPPSGRFRVGNRGAVPHQSQVN